MKKKVAVAMSGGVDSSLTAAILVYKGFEVVGVTMWLETGECERQSCCNSKDIEEARLISEKLGIKHFVADFRNYFREEIENYFIAEYLRGRTPNPCVRCNQKIKFGKLFEFVDYLEADFLATGHYARIIFEDNRFKLKRAIDEKKDQSYVLYNLTKEKLSRILFPLGEFSKTTVRRIAKDLNLQVAQKPDSQEICFISDGDYKKFIRQREPNSQAFQSGDIIDATGKILGKHQGIANYTIGQRRGLGISAPNALYVTRLDIDNCCIEVGGEEKIFSKNLKAYGVHWIYKPELPKILGAKIRYASRLSKCEVSEKSDFLYVEFEEPQRAITPGQSIVFYDGDEVLGGAIIDRQ